MWVSYEIRPPKTSKVAEIQDAGKQNAEDSEKYLIFKNLLGDRAVGWALIMQGMDISPSFIGLTKDVGAPLTLELHEDLKGQGYIIPSKCHMQRPLPLTTQLLLGDWSEGPEVIGLLLLSHNLKGKQ